MEFEDQGKKIRSRDLFKQKIEAAYYYATDPSASNSRRRCRLKGALPAASQPHAVSLTPLPAEPLTTPEAEAADESSGASGASGTSGASGASSASDLIAAMFK